MCTVRYRRAVYTSSSRLIVLDYRVMRHAHMLLDQQAKR